MAKRLNLKLLMGLSAFALVLGVSGARAEQEPLNAKGMLPLCKDELAKRSFGPCTGYIVAIYDEMRSRNLRTVIQITRGHNAEELQVRGACLVLEMNLRPLREAVISWIETKFSEYAQPGHEPSMYEMTLDALRHAWGCSTPAPVGFLP